MLEGKSTIPPQPSAGDSGNKMSRRASGWGGDRPCPRGCLGRAPPPSGRMGSVCPPPRGVPGLVGAPLHPPAPRSSRAPNVTGAGVHSLSEKWQVAPPAPTPCRPSPAATTCHWLCAGCRAATMPAPRLPKTWGARPQRHLRRGGAGVGGPGAAPHLRPRAEQTKG